MRKQEDIPHIYASPIMLLDPARVASDRKYKYALELCPKTVRNKAQIIKSVRKEKYNLTTGQCKPIFSAFNIYRHYLTTEQFERASQLPLVMLFFERATHAHQLCAEFKTYMHPEYVVWATSNAGVNASRKCYQTLETYGDTVLKVAGTFLAYNYLRSRSASTQIDESKIDQLKNQFITNLYFLRVGKRLGIQRYIRTADPDLKQWSPPFTEQVTGTESLTCTGKHIADVLEAVIGAHFMSNSSLRKTLLLINDMSIMPLKHAGVLEYFPEGDLTFRELREDIDSYGFQITDSVT